MPSSVEQIDRVLVHPVLWGILSLIALAIALSGRFSSQGANWMVGVAVAMTTFVVFSSASRMDMLLRILVTAGLGLLLAASGLVFARWLSAKQVKYEPPINSHELSANRGPVLSKQDAVPTASNTDVQTASVPNIKKKKNDPLVSALPYKELTPSADPTRLNDAVGGSINIGGHAKVGSAQVVNNFGTPSPRPLVITVDQMLAITSESSAFAGKEVVLSWELSADDTEIFAANLGAALQAAGLIVRKEPAMFVLMDNMKPPPPGLTFSFHDEGKQLMSAIAKALYKSGFPVPPNGFPALPSISQDKARALTIYIGRAQIAEVPLSR